MVPWKISVAIYRPRYGNYKHWALCAAKEDGKRPFIYEVIGQHGTFQANVLRVRPEDSARFVESVHVGEVHDRDFKDFEEAIKATIVDNETVHWDCQDYVLEILENLEEDCVLDGDDRVYQRQKRKLKNMRGEY